MTTPEMRRLNSGPVRPILAQTKPTTIINTSIPIWDTTCDISIYRFPLTPLFLNVQQQGRQSEVDEQGHSVGYGGYERACHHRGVYAYLLSRHGQGAAHGLGEHDYEYQRHGDGSRHEHRNLGVAQQHPVHQKHLHKV